MPEPSVSEPDFWESSYQRGETGWDIGRPAPPLVSWLTGPEGPSGQLRVAVLGCGRGHDALSVAQAGHDVTGFDFAPTAIAAARQRAAERGLAARFEQADIFTLPARFQAAFDLVVEHTCFCAIDPGRRGEYVSAVRALLADGGRLVGLFFAHGQPGGPPFTTTPDELQQLFGAVFEIERLDWAQDSIPQRANQELLVVMRKAR